MKLFLLHALKYISVYERRGMLSALSWFIAGKHCGSTLCLHLHYGVLQGAILSPMLFNSYMKTLEADIRTLDDTAIFLHNVGEPMDSSYTFNTYKSLFFTNLAESLVSLLSYNSLLARHWRLYHISALR